MSSIEVTQTESPKIGAWILLGRHAVAILAVLAIYAAVASRLDGFLIGWVGAAIVVFGAAAVIAGLALLFFTRTETGKTITTFRNAAWVLSGLLVFDPMFHLNLRSLWVSSVRAELHEIPSTVLDSSGGALPRQSLTIADPANSPEPAIEVVQEARNEVLAFRGVEEKTFRGVTSNAIASARLPTECKDHSGASLESRRAKLADLRNSYPSLANEDDVAVVRAVHAAFYADLPIACVSDALGVAMPGH